MQIVEPERILTLDEIEKLLQLSDPSPIASAIKSGELPALHIGSDTRIVGKDLNDFLLAKRSARNGNSADATNGSSQSRATQLKLKKSAPFTHKWPDSTKERYRDVQEGSVTVNGSVRAVKIGFTNREAAGKDRERAAVFIDGRPLVEFCGADDFAKSNVMASIIKIDGKQVRPIQGVPKQYSQLKVDRYQKFVTGPYAYSNLAVYCTKDDTSTMVEHALIRLEDIG